MIPKFFFLEALYPDSFGFSSLLLDYFLGKIEVMTRYKATISYDGYAFAGFQRQPHARSVQEEIEKP